MTSVPGSWPIGPDGGFVGNQAALGPPPAEPQQQGFFTRNIFAVLNRFRSTNNVPDDGGPDTSTNHQPQQNGHVNAPTNHINHTNGVNRVAHVATALNRPAPFRRTPLPSREVSPPGSLSAGNLRFSTNEELRRRHGITQRRPATQTQTAAGPATAPGPAIAPGPSGSQPSLSRPPAPQYKGTRDLFDHEQDISLPGTSAPSEPGHFSPNERKADELESVRQKRERRAEERRAAKQRLREADERINAAEIRARRAQENLRELKELAAAKQRTVTEPPSQTSSTSQPSSQASSETHSQTDLREPLRQEPSVADLRKPNRNFISPLSTEWDAKVDASTRSGFVVNVPNPEGLQISAHDFRTLVSPTAWLNDNIIQGALAHLAHHINDSAGVVFRKDPPKCIALSPLFWTYLGSGNTFTRRLSRTWGLTSDNFLSVDTILLPINHGNHWTVVVIRPSSKTVAYVDSFYGSGRGHLETAFHFIRTIIGPAFAEGEWRTLSYKVPRQTNGYDCGAFVIANSVFLALGLDPSAYRGAEMPLFRRVVAAVLVGGGFRGEFDLAGL